MSVLDESGILEERRDRPRSNTWPLPDPSEFTKPERDVDQPGLKQLSASEGPKKSSRKNAWGNLSYADLITQAIQSSSEQRLTLSQIYDWMVNTVPYFRDKGDSNSSAGWKNSIRHNLSLHSKFVRVQNEGNGKSSWWMLNPDAKGGKTSRRRSGSLDSAPKSEKKRGRSRKEKIKEEDSDSPSSPRLSVSRARDANRANSPGNVSPTNSSSSDSLLTIPETDSPSPFALGDSFARPRTSSNASTVSSLGGRLSPIPAHEDELELCEDHVPTNNFNMVSNPNSAADELSQMADSMTLSPFAAENNNRIKQTLTPVQPQLLPSEPRSDISGMAVSNSITSSISPNSFDTGYNSSGYLQPIQHPQQSLSPEMLPPQTIAAPQPVFGNLRSYSQSSMLQPHFQRNYRSPQEMSPRQCSTPARINNVYCDDQDMEIQQTPENFYQNFQVGFGNNNPCVNGLPQNHQSFNYVAEPFPQQQRQQVTPVALMIPENGLLPSHQQGHPFGRDFRTTNNNQLELMNEKFPSDLELDVDNLNGDLDCDFERILYDELNMGDGGFDINIEQYFNQIPNIGELRSGLY